MKIQLLHFPDCPNAETARAALHEAITQEHLDLQVDELDVSREDTPAWAKGWGSPTILIDGRDVGGEAASSGDGQLSALPRCVPSVALIRERLRATTSGEASASAHSVVPRN